MAVLVAPVCEDSPAKPPKLGSLWLGPLKAEGQVVDAVA